ncbi:hypothetical protein B4U79_14833 [Dinothrombium tinctorium]|uniref:Uncharacterized protein n=1 Tax=Dinothrombium tinctorium TaxID=1965070 RepID=A0A443QUA2_9ACAR|nr:hypothetical protein B4U79_14833 [Dinothrombium tinctorium]
MKVNISDEIEQKAELRLKELLGEAVLLGPISDTIDPEIPPKWFDKALFEKGQHLAQKYYIRLISILIGLNTNHYILFKLNVKHVYSLNVAHLAGLMLGIQLPLALVPLLSTGRSKTVSRLFKRYQSTQLRVKIWYEEDPFDKNSKAFHSFRAVRAMHGSVCDKMNKGERREFGKDRVWISQCEMAMTLWAFMGLLILYPKECGLHRARRDHFEAFIHMWRVFAYTNGIADRFNICSGNFEETYALFQLILNKVFKPLVIRCPDEVGIEMSKGIVKALRPITPTLRWQVFMTYWYNILDIPNEIQLSDWKKRIRFREQKFILANLLKYSTFHWLLGNLLKLNIKYQNYKKKRVQKNMECKYADIIYEAKCVYNLDSLKQE